MSEVRPFKVDVPQAALDDLSARLKAARWIEDVVGGDPNYGATLGFVRELRDHWLNSFDWRSFEARINAQPNFLADVDDLTVHFIHRRSSREDAIPLILMHGWPSSFLEFLDVCEPLAEPPSGDPAFHVVVPSLPGNAFSTTRPGESPQRVAARFVSLMEQLGYRRFMIQGGNWGAVLGTEMARQFPDRVIGLHINSINGSPPPDREQIPLNPEEESWVSQYNRLFDFPHFAVLTQKPISPAHALNDSPIGLAAWIGEKLWDWSDNRHGRGLSLDWTIATIALFWLTGTIGASSLIYYEMVHDMMQERYVSTPTAAVIFSEEFVRIPRPWAERHYNILRWTRHDRGGHFPATEVPDLFVADVRGFARDLNGA